MGDFVEIRRWRTADKTYTPWMIGQVVRPVFCKAQDVSPIIPWVPLWFKFMIFFLARDEKKDDLWYRIRTC